MPDSLINSDQSSQRWSDMDPTGEVHLGDPVMVNKAIQAILDTMRLCSPPRLKIW